MPRLRRLLQKKLPSQKHRRNIRRLVCYDSDQGMSTGYRLFGSQSCIRNIRVVDSANSRFHAAAAHTLHRPSGRGMRSPAQR